MLSGLNSLPAACPTPRFTKINSLFGKNKPHDYNIYETESNYDHRENHILGLDLESAHE